MLWLTLALLTAALSCLYRYLRKRCDYFKELGLPYVPGWPLLGNMAWTALRRQHITRTIRDIYDYMPEARYIGAFDFVRPVIVIRDAELIKEIAIKNADSFSDRHTFVYESSDPLFGSNMLLMHGDRWREIRGVLSPAFTPSKLKTVYYSQMTKCAENFVKHMTKLTNAEPDNVIDVKQLFSKYANDVIVSCSFGIDVDSLDDPKNPFFALGMKATSFDGVLSVKALLFRAFPEIMRDLRVKVANECVTNFFMDVVGRTIAMRDEQGISRPDMIQLLMDARGKTSSNLKLSMTEIAAQAFLFFFAGFDTTATQMCAIAHEFILNPEIQSKLQAEIDSVLAKTPTGCTPSYEDVNAMPYLEAVFSESMRCHIQSSEVDRVCVKPFELPPALPGCKPFIVQPGMNIWMPVAAIHMDKRYHKNPDTFEPERYLDKKITINDAVNLGFGIGPRSCLGRRFAILETKVFFFHLLAKFNVKPNARTRMDFELDVRNVSVTPKGGYWLTLEPRK